MFDKDLLSLGILMNKTHRNSAVVCVKDGDVIIVNGDGTLAIRYLDPTTNKLNINFKISDFPDNLSSIRKTGDSINFVVKKGNSTKTITVKSAYDYYSDLILLFDSFKKVDNFVTIPDDSISLLDDTSFFTIIVGDEIKLKQFHGYSGTLSIIESKLQTLDSFFTSTKQNDNEIFEIGTITDIFKLLYSFFDYYTSSGLDYS